MSDVFDIVIPEGSSIRTAIGSRVFYKGEEVKDVSEIDILPLTPDGIMFVKITVPLGNITSE